MYDGKADSDTSVYFSVLQNVKKIYLQNQSKISKETATATGCDVAIYKSLFIDLHSKQTCRCGLSKRFDG